MKIKILSQKNNPLLKRREIIFEVDHSQEGQTTPRSEIQKKLSNILTTKLDLIVVKKVETKTGTTTALGEANAYETTQQLKLVEPEHIIDRNTLTEKQVVEQEKPAKEDVSPAKEEQQEKKLKPKEKAKDDPGEQELKKEKTSSQPEKEEKAEKKGEE